MITRLFLRYACSAVILCAPGALLAQKWELGVVGGGGFYSNATVNNPLGNGDVGFKSGPAVGAFVGSNMYKYLGGELRYEYRPGDLKLASGGTNVTFSGESHAIHYDFLWHLRTTESRVRPFFAAGGGVKIYRGTGTASPVQPLSKLALLTQTNEAKGLATVAAGIKVAARRGIGLRVEIRDFITPFPRQVIAPALNSTISGWLHDVVFLAGVSFNF